MVDPPHPTRPSSGPKTPSPKAKTSAGRGLIAIGSAKIWFILTGFGIKFALPHLLGSPEEFGFYETAMSAVSILNMVLIASTIQTVSKFVSQKEEESATLLRQGLRIQFVVGGVLASAVFMLAPAIASFLRDDALAPLLRVAALVVVAYAFYGAIVGSLNGRRMFGHQAKLDASFSLLRSTGIIGGAALGLGAIGAISGFAAAAVVIVLLAFVVVRGELRGKKTKGLPLKAWAAFMAPIWLYQAALNGCLQIDGLVLKRTVAQLVVEGGGSMAEGARIASEQVGFYRAAQTFAFVPYQLILALTFIIFPMVSRATSVGDEAAAKRAVSGALRFSFLVLLAIAAPIAGAAQGTLRIAYPEVYVAPGAPALSILAIGMVGFALFVIASTILSSIGRPSFAAKVAGVALVTIILSGNLLVRYVGVGPNTLPALALGTSAGTTLACLIAFAGIYHRFRVLIPIRTVISGALAAAVAAAVAHHMPQGSRLAGLMALIVGGVSYLVMLAVTRELTNKEFVLLRGLLKR